MPFSPAGNLTTTATLRHLATVYYSRTALDRVEQFFVFNEGCTPDVLPLRQGKVVQWFRFTLPGANTTPASEGTIGTSLVEDSATVTATVAEYSDYMNSSTFLDETSINPMAEQMAKDIGYRAALTNDTLARTEFDSPASTTAVWLDSIDANGSSADFRQAVALLSGTNVRPKKGMDYAGIIHPYALYDVRSDNTAGGFIDVMKYANPKAFVEGQAPAAETAEVGKIEGCRLFKSTNVGTTGTAPTLQYYTYVIGEGACGAVALSGRGPSNVRDPRRQNFKVNVLRGGPSMFDPEGKIGSAVSYRYVTAYRLLDTTTYRYRIIRMDSSIV